MNELVVGPGTQVTLLFALKLDNGDLVDSTFERSPASFIVGDGKLLPGFERKLFGLGKGAREQFTILPEDAFGQPNPANVQRFNRDIFGADMELHPGLVISFADAAQAELPGVISGFDGDEVLVDFNHPLAGRTLLFDVQIFDVTTADETSGE